jgi:modulator of FtsH protease HflK
MERTDLEGPLNMAWNEPGGKGGNGRSGWDRGGDGDLDKLIRGWQAKYGKFLGNGMLPLLVIAFLLWLATGVYKIDAAQQGVVLRFGALQEITEPGLHWHLPIPIEHVEKVDVNQVQRRDYESEMLTSDYNIVALELSVQFRVRDPEDFLFNVQNPEATLEEVTASSVREVVGQRTAEVVLTTGRAEVVATTRQQIQDILDSYGAGLVITQVNLEEVRFPGPVLAAVQDVNSAEQDRQRKIREAEAYYNDVVPNARGQAARMLAEAQAYRQQRIFDAEGEVARFSALYEQYRLAPEVTRQRMYLEMIEQVYAGARKVIVEGEGNMLLIELGDMPADAMQRFGLPAAGAMNENEEATDAERTRSGLRDRGRP